MQSYTPSPSHVKPGLGKPAPGKIAPSSDAKRKQRRYRIGVAALLVLVLAIWYFRPNAQAAKVRQLQNDLFAASSQLTADQKKQKFDALRAESEKLSPADRKEVRKDMEKQFQTKMNSEAVQYLAMSPAERRKVIDAKIAKEQTMQQKRPANPPGGNAQAPPNAVNGVAVAGNGPGGGQRGPTSPEDQDSKRRSMLLHASAEARAGMDQMRLDMATRRAQLGLPASTGKAGPR